MRGEEEHGREADVAEHEADDPARERDGEAPGAEGNQLKSVQGRAFLRGQTPLRLPERFCQKGLTLF